MKKKGFTKPTSSAKPKTTSFSRPVSYKTGTVKPFLPERYRRAVADLEKALEAGSYDAAPSKLKQGSGLDIESLKVKMTNVKFTDKKIKLKPKDMSKVLNKAKTIKDPLYTKFSKSLKPKAKGMSKPPRPTE